MTLDDVRAVLGKIEDPALHMDLETAGMVKSLTAENGHVRVGIELTTPACPQRDMIETSIKAAIGRLPEVTHVDVAFTANVRARSTMVAGGRLPGVKNVIAVAAGKGGVGKSTVATNLAAALHVAGARVGILDADIYGPSIPRMMGTPDVPASVDKGDKIIPAVHHGLSVISVGFFVERKGAVIWRGPMVHKLLQQFLEDVAWGELDYLVMDLPPGTGDAQLSLSQLVPITGAVMVTTPQEVSLIDVEKAVSMWKRVEVPILGVVENMSHFKCPGCGHREEIFSHGGGRALAEREGVPFLGEIPIVSAIRSAGDVGTPIVLRDPNSAVARAFQAVAGAVACGLSQRHPPEASAGKRSSSLVIR